MARIRLLLAAFLGLLALGPTVGLGQGLGLGLGLGLGPTPALAQDGADISIPVLPGRAGGSPKFVSVSIGGGPPSEVSVDTGSVGLYVFQRQVGADVRLTDTKLHQAYADGTNFRGVIGLARVRFTDASGVAGTRAMAIGIITEVSCAQSRPNCPGSDRKPGIMGVGMDTGGRLASPLAQLAGPAGDGFVVDLRPGAAPRLVLGPSTAILSRFRFAALQPGRPSTIGLPSWDAGSVLGTYSVDGQPAPAQPVLFDTGEFDAVFDPGPIRSMRLGPHGFLLPGQSFALAVPGALALRIDTDRSMFIKPRTTRRSNIGALAFRYAAIAFDARRGRIGFMQ